MRLECELSPPTGVEPDMVSAHKKTRPKWPGSWGMGKS